MLVPSPWLHASQQPVALQQWAQHFLWGLSSRGLEQTTGATRAPAAGLLGAASLGKDSSQGLKAEQFPFREASPDTEEPLSTHPLDALGTLAGMSRLDWQGLRLCSSPGWCFTGLGRHCPLETPLVKARCFLF
ncbi:unnamed protein product [Rangifer tarandus platyrhynchus]|uniref:Uncharacterized protein n=1 Tax=Rangifer tarandus platyrhynchus TaxID=3082113 RepID=A0ABN8ZQ15_RANTA|nr:unnamed protein product [Rangifer tarandus platyrhynchus]